MIRQRELTFDERATWGECPVCNARDGVPCNGFVGIALGRNVNGDPAPGGVHLGRLTRAPRAIQIVPVP
jgi:hypothetical protein